MIDGIPLYWGITAFEFKGRDRDDYSHHFANLPQRAKLAPRELPSELESLAAYQDVELNT